MKQIVFVLFIYFILHTSYVIRVSPVHAAPSILSNSITNNASDYPGSEIPKYEKFEVTFQIDQTAASNVQLPYINDPGPNQYLAKYVGVGISVDALFLPPGETDWTNAYSQPAFYYQEFLDEVRDNDNWFYPTDNYSWKVRFAPHVPGDWQYKLVATDAGGTVESIVGTFTVVNSNNKGFVKVSETDPRYFEFDDGSYFSSLGYNMAMSWLYEDSTLTDLSSNGVNFIRAWLGPFNIFGSQWSAWQMMPGHYDGYLPRVPLLPYEPSPGEPMVIRWYLSQDSGWYEACAHLGHTQQSPAVKPNTDYFVRARYKTVDVAGPRIATDPDYGFVLKLGGWAENCSRKSYPDDPIWSIVTPITNYGLSSNWDEVKGVWNSGGNNFLPRFYMSLENVSTGKVFIESIEMIEMTGGTVDNPTLTGSNVIDKYSPEIQTYMAQKPSYKMDKIVEKLKAHDMYVRPVILEKNEYVFKKLDAYGNALFEDEDSNFYGSRADTAPRWLQKAWWRYLQARWGYSTNIHSWELVNEGNPGSIGHYEITDELGKYMHCDAFGVSSDNNGNGFSDDGETCNFKTTENHPNDHLVTTSFWHSFPVVQFFNNTKYPNVDTANVHAYISTSGEANCQEKYDMQFDAAYFHTFHSARYGGWIAMNKPVVRGETGIDGFNENPNGRCTIVDSSGQTKTGTFNQSQSNLGITGDTQGIWYHNFVWAGLHYGALHELYWWTSHIWDSTFDHRYHIKHYSSFVSSIPLNNGFYQDAQAQSANTNLRIVGQKDMINGNAHLWIQNKNHTWKNVVDNVSIQSITDSITISGFTPNKTFTIEWWDTYTGQISNIKTQNANASGDIILDSADHPELQNLTSDVAVKILNPDTSQITPTPTTQPRKPGDTDGDNDVDISDLSTLLATFGSTGSGLSADFDQDQDVDISDLSTLLANFGS